LGNGEARRPSEDIRRLDSWKEIAAFVGRDVRTVQRWEKEEGLPVHRQAHKRLGTIHAFRPEIDAWLERRRDVVDNPPSVLPRRKPWMVASAAMVFLLAAGGLWLRFFDAGEQQPVASRIVPVTTYPGDVGGGSFSPDASQIAFSWNGGNQDNYDIYVKVLDAETALRLTSDPAPEGFAAWSPDGRQIAFGRSKRPWSPPASIYLISPVGGPQRRIAELVPVDYYVPLAGLAWSPDGKWLAFPDLSSPDGPFCLYAISPETGEKRKLTAPPATSLGDGLPAFSPDGRMLAFVRATSYESADIYLMPAQQGTPVRLTNDKSRIRGLSWTANSQELVFSSNRDHQPALWRISARGGAPRRLPDTASADALVAVSSTHHRLTFTRMVSDENIWRAEVRGGVLTGNRSRLIGSTRADSNPQYSPDGKRIAFASDRSGTWEIWVCESDGSNPFRVTNFGTGASSWPSWSPDGKRIAFDSTAGGGGHEQIFTVSAYGGRPQPLTVEPAENAAPHWSTDGWIYFQSNRDGDLQVWKIPGTGGAAVRVTKHGGSRPAVSSDGKMVYYAKKQDEVWRIPVAGGEESRFITGVEDVFHGRWAPVERGFYFVQRTGPRRLLKFLDFETGRTAEVMPLEKPMDVFALSVSPDRRSLLYSQTDYEVRELLSIENFR
jgi:Tol biopolymer transport system component